MNRSRFFLSLSLGLHSVFGWQVATLSYSSLGIAVWCELLQHGVRLKPQQQRTDLSQLSSNRNHPWPSFPNGRQLMCNPIGSFIWCRVGWATSRKDPFFLLAPSRSCCSFEKYDSDFPGPKTSRVHPSIHQLSNRTRRGWKKKNGWSLKIEQCWVGGAGAYLHHHHANEVTKRAETATHNKMRIKITFGV